MSDSLLYYKPRALVDRATETLPGTLLFTHYTKLYGAGAVPVDRTGTIKTPVKVSVPFPLPKFRPMHRSYEEICNERATELIARAEKLDAKIYISWSGGIDSTLVLVSMLKNATPQQQKRFIVLLSDLSIDEYPLFYETFIRGKLKTDTASALPVVLGTPNMIINGEHNDQIFGSDIMAPIILKHGNQVIHQKYNRDILFGEYFNAVGDATIANFYLDLFERLPASSPIPIETMYDFTWWINFSLKWATVYTRILTFTAPVNKNRITESYAMTYFEPFYNTEEFQLWSLNNQDKKIKDSWVTYKWPCKEIICDFTKDAVYRDTKLKVGSLGSFLRSKRSYEAIDTEFKLYDELDLEKYYNPDNDFMKLESYIANVPRV